MGILDEITGVGAFGSLLGGQAAQLGYPYGIYDIFGRPFGGAIQPPPFAAMQYKPPRKHVESREVKGMEKARKQINGAVQAVKDAQDKAK
ncbi:MAG: hypothetical protein HWN69_07060 [Desulfobacterales bacterium]|nr:hypothetical protein [Desulfobacterales bacterium]